MVTWENKVYLCWVNGNGSCVRYGGSPVYFLVQSCPVQSFCYCIFAHESVTSCYWGGGCKNVGWALSAVLLVLWQLWSGSQDFMWVTGEEIKGFPSVSTASTPLFLHLHAFCSHHSAYASSTIVGFQSWCDCTPFAQALSIGLKVMTCAGKQLVSQLEIYRETC